MSRRRRRRTSSFGSSTVPGGIGCSEGGRRREVSPGLDDLQRKLLKRLRVAEGSIERRRKPPRGWSDCPLAGAGSGFVRLGLDESKGRVRRDDAARLPVVEGGSLALRLGRQVASGMPLARRGGRLKSVFVSV